MNTSSMKAGNQRLAGFIQKAIALVPSLRDATSEIFAEKISPAVWISVFRQQIEERAR